MYTMRLKPQPRNPVQRLMTPQSPSERSQPKSLHLVMLMLSGLSIWAQHLVLKLTSLTPHEQLGNITIRKRKHLQRVQCWWAGKPCRTTKHVVGYGYRSRRGQYTSSHYGSRAHAADDCYGVWCGQRIVLCAEFPCTD